jgi:CheY-like chemotaxis protein
MCYAGFLMAAQQERATPRLLLLVDDDETNLYIREKILAKSGYECVAIASPAEAIEEVGKRDFDAVLLDYVMPQMKGDEVFRQIRAKRPDMPIIMVTAGQYIPMELQREANAWCVKLEGPQALLSTLERIFKSRP